MHTLRAAAPRRSASLTGLFPNLSTSQANDHRQLANHTQTAHRPGNYPPQRKDLLGGLKFTRRFSHNEVHPYDEVDWTRRDVRIMDWKTGKTIYERLRLEAPAHWDDNAVKITADKYLFGSEPGSLEYEDSFRNIYDRISNTYTVWGWEEGYFATLEDAEIFNEEIKAMLVQQIWAPNSPCLVQHRPLGAVALGTPGPEGKLYRPRQQGLPYQGDQEQSENLHGPVHV